MDASFTNTLITGTVASSSSIGFKTDGATEKPMFELSDKPVVKEIMPGLKKLIGKEEVLKKIETELKKPEAPKPGNIGFGNWALQQQQIPQVSNATNGWWVNASTAVSWVDGTARVSNFSA